MSETCRLYALLMMVLPLLFILSVGHRSRDKGFAWCIMVGATLYEVFSFSVPLILGNLGYLTVDLYREIMWGVAVVAALFGLLRFPVVVKTLIGVRYRPRWEDIPLAAALWLVWTLVRHDHQFNWVTGPVQFDAMNYHIPRALQWIWNGSMQPYRTSIWQQVGHAYGGTASAVTPVFYGCGFLGSGFNSFVYNLGAAAAVLVIGRALGLSVRAALAGALAFLSFPAIGVRFADVNTDIAAAFPVIAGTALFLTRDNLGQGLRRFIALVGMGTACKQYVAFPAVPIGLMLIAPHLRALGSVRNIGSATVGMGVGLVACALSYYPIYLGFGDLTGGGVAHQLSTIQGGMPAVREALEYTFVSWFLEPLGAVPPEPRGEIFQALNLAPVYKSIAFDVGPQGPSLDNEHTRSGVLPMLLLPWLLLGVPRGKRLYALLGFTAICLAQFTPLARNHSGGRFAIIPLAAFALLWGARAARRGFVVATLIVVALAANYEYLRHWHLWGEKFIPEREDNWALGQRLNGETALLLSSDLSVDALVSGKLATVRYTYVNCPLDGDWVKMLADYKQRYRYFILPASHEKFVPGPLYVSRFGKECQRISVDEIRAWLTQSGWRFDRIAYNRIELWTTEPITSPVQTPAPSPNG